MESGTRGAQRRSSGCGQLRQVGPQENQRSSKIETRPELWFAEAIESASRQEHDSCCYLVEEQEPRSKTMGEPRPRPHHHRQRPHFRRRRRLPMLLEMSRRGGSSEPRIFSHQRQQLQQQEQQKRQRQSLLMRSLSKQLLLRPQAMLVALVVLQCGATLARGQCPVNTMTSFEQIGGVAVKDSLLTVLYTAPNVSSHTHRDHSALGSAVADLSRQLGASSMSIPITAECNNRCRRSAKCRAFLVDYGRHTCYSIEHLPGSAPATSAGGLVRSPTPIQLVPTQERTSYFEKVCLNLPAIECERAWIFERVMGHQMHGHDDKIIDDVPTRLRCEEHCLNEREFRCRSGEYDSFTMQCRLSIVDRHLKPNSFRPSSPNVDYFENQCVPVGSQCDAFDRFEDVDLGRAEIMRSANTSDQCQQFCTQTIKAFICRSFTWNQLTGKCYLNSANSFMVGGLERLVSAPGLTYYQRNDCIDLRLECDTSAMTLNLRTNEPFRGRMYVRDEPNACETLGRSSLTSSLSIPFQSGGSHARCATRELPSRYSSVVVVQQHPLIQRKSDRYIKLVCDFQTANKTITSTYNVVANPWTSTALINATSFAPKIRLRITDKFGVDITGAKLGDELYLRIEAESESVYDMVARSVLAKSGTTDESIVLIDKDGCPTDFRIFPALKKLNRRTILGKFDAFKFSSDVVVRFQVDVQFCLNQCPPTSCDHINGQPNNLLLLNSAGAPSFGGLSAETYSAGSLSTATAGVGTSPAPTGLLSLSDGGSGSSSTPLAAPPSSSSFGQQQHHHQRAPQSNFSATGAHNGYPFGGGDQGAASYYSSAGPSLSAGGRHPSVPANNPPGANYTPTAASQQQQQQSILDSLSSPVGTSTSDPQIFEPSQPRSGSSLMPAAKWSGGGGSSSSMASAGATTAKSRESARQRQQQQQSAGTTVDPNGNNNNNNLSAGPVSFVGASGSAAATAEPPTGQQLDHEQSNAHRRRKRRSSFGSAAESESAAPVPRHVPLQREIIVESSPPPQQQRGNSNHNSPTGKRLKSSSHGHRAAGARNAQPEQQADGLTRNGPAYDLNGNRVQPGSGEPVDDQSPDNGTLLCTTRHSLVLASMAFCTVQLLTVGLCLVTWMHRRDVKFKVKHPIEERLY